MNISVTDSSVTDSSDDSYMEDVDVNWQIETDENYLELKQWWNNVRRQTYKRKTGVRDGIDTGVIVAGSRVRRRDIKRIAKIGVEGRKIESTEELNRDLETG